MAQEEAPQFSPEGRLKITVRPENLKPPPLPEGYEPIAAGSTQIQGAPSEPTSAPPPGVPMPSGYEPIETTGAGAPPAETAALPPFKGGGGDFRGEAPAAPLPEGYVPYNDIRDYPHDQPEMATEGFQQMSKGVGQLGKGSVLPGLFNTAVGGLEYVTSPIQAGIRSAVGRPVERYTGIPKEYTEFGTALMIPGYGLSGLKSVANSQFLKNSERAIKKILAPSTLSPEAGAAAATLRETSGGSARASMKAQDAIEPFQARFNALDDAQKLQFVNYIEKGPGHLQNPRFRTPQGRIRMEGAAQTLQHEFQLRKNELASMPETQQMTFVQDFFPHFWTNPGQARSTFGGGVGRQGSAASTKKRTIPTITEGIQQGLTPLTTDPVEMAMRYIASMDQFIASTKALSVAREQGYARYLKIRSVGASGHPESIRGVPLGWAPLQGRGATRTTPGGTYRLYAPEDYALVYNNFIDRGIHDWGGDTYGKLYDQYMRASNSLTAFQLGLSGYHAFTMAEEAFASSMANAASKIFQGVKQLDPRMVSEGAKKIVTSPAAPITYAMKGNKVRDVYLGRTRGTQDFRKITDLLEKAGGRGAGTKHAQDYRFSQMGSYWTSWKRGALKAEIVSDVKDLAGRPIARFVPQTTKQIGRLMATVAQPLFEHYIPLLKNGAFYDTMSTWLKANPTASHEQTLVAARKIWDSVDNRFGEMVADNLFWNKTQKQVAQASLLSYSWTLGAIREIGGGAIDIVKTRGKALDITSPEYSSKAAYAIGFPAAMMTVHSVYQYLKSGEFPEQPRDLLAPKTGGLAPPIGGEYEPRLTKKGVPYKGDTRSAAHPVLERALLPGYQKDVYGWYMHPVQEAKNKAAPLLKLMWDTVENQDWAGKQIYNPEAPIPVWLEQYLKYVGQSVGVPISIKTATQPAYEDTNISRLEKLTGIRNAPTYFQDPEGYNRFKIYRHEKAQAEREKFEDPEKYKKRAEEAEKRRQKNKGIKEKLYGGPQ